MPNILPFLLPTPQRINLSEGQYELSGDKLILLAANPQALLFSAGRLQDALKDSLHLNWQLAASSVIPAEQVGISLCVAGTAQTPQQGYTLDISPQGILVDGNDAAGVFYGICTLIQLIDQYGAHIPCLHITDWPDFPSRGVMLDISRDKVPTMETLYGLIDMLASWKINQFQLYTEHTFAYRQHPEVWAHASPLTGQEILELDAYCHERYIELVPNQNSFGHMHRWLELPRYAPLAEIHGTFEGPWGPRKGPWGLCPTDPGSLDLVKSLYDELLPHFSSRMVNVGCDETFDLGCGRSKEACDGQGHGQVYLDYLLKIYKDLKGRSHTIQFWGDIILKYPNCIPDIPKDTIALDWGYESDFDFAGQAEKFANAGIPYYVCPGTSSWNSFAGRSDNALGNLLNAAENGLKYGAIGYLNTDWGDNGHMQMLPVSFLGFAAGAAYSWALESNRKLDIQHALSLYAFRDRSDALGCVAYELGNVYLKTGADFSNDSFLFLAINWHLEKLQNHYLTPKVPFWQILEAIDQAAMPISYIKIDEDRNPLRKEALLVREFDFTARILRHACWRGLLACGATSECPNETNPPADDTQFRHKLDWDMETLIGDYEELWMERNRPGGLRDSVAHLERARNDYAVN